MCRAGVDGAAPCVEPRGMKCPLEASSPCCGGGPPPPPQGAQRRRGALKEGCGERAGGRLRGPGLLRQPPLEPHLCESAFRCR